MAFPADSLGVRARLLLGGEWVDVTEHLMSETAPVRISRGRRNEASAVDAGTCSLTLLDPDGRYAPRNPMGLYYGLIGRGTELEVSVRTDTRWLDVARDSDTTATPVGPGPTVTGDLDVRIDLACALWGDPSGNTELIGRYDPLTTGGKGWMLLLGDDGRLVFGWSADGQIPMITASDAVVAFAPGARATLRATLDVDNGAGGSTVTYYTGPSLAGPWTQLGTPAVTPPRAIYATATPLEIGDLQAVAAAMQRRRIYGVELRDGIDGTVVASPDFTVLAPDTDRFTDSAGVEWALSTPIGRRVRFRGRVPDWPQSRRPRARTRVSVQAAGIISRLGLAPDDTDSVLLKSVRAASSTVAYWPLEDGATATLAHNALPGGPPLQVQGLAFAQDDTLISSSPLPVVQSGAVLRGPVPSAAPGEFQVEFVYRTPDDVFPSPGGTSQILRFRTTSATWTVTVGTTSVTLTVDDGSGSPLQFTDGNSPPLGDWARLYVQAYQSGGTVEFEVGSMVVGTLPTTFADSFTGTVGNVTAIDTAFPFDLVGMSIGHLSVSDTDGAYAYEGADAAWASWGETAAGRIQRLCAESGTPLRQPWPGGTDVEEVGAQAPGRTLDLCRAAADLDMGILYEARQAAALAYRPRYTLYNQTPTVLQYANASGLAAMEPAEDEQGLHNRVTVARTEGTTVVAEADSGPLAVADVGVYNAQSLTLGLHTDDQVAPQAWWRLHVGTYDGARYPAVRILLHRAPDRIDAVAALDSGDMLRVEGMPTELEADGVDLLVQGYTETLGVRTWEIEFVTSPGAPWQVGTLDDEGRLDTDGTVLDEDAGADDTTLSLAAAGGYLWTTDPGDYPIRLLLASGELVTATGCTGESSPQSMTVVRGVNGIRRPWPAGTDVRLAAPMIVSL